MLSMGRTVRGDQLVETSAVLFASTTARSDEAHPSGQPSAVFTARTATANEVVFENPRARLSAARGLSARFGDSLLCSGIDGTTGGIVAARRVSESTGGVPVIALDPVAYVRSARSGTDDDNWVSRLRSIVEHRGSLSEESLDGIEEFSHAEIIFVFDQIDEQLRRRGTTASAEQSRLAEGRHLRSAREPAPKPARRHHRADSRA